MKDEDALKRINEIIENQRKFMLMAHRNKLWYTININGTAGIPEEPSFKPNFRGREDIIDKLDRT